MEEIRKRRGVLQSRGGIRAVEAAAVSSQLLDSHLGRLRTERHDRLGHLLHRRRIIGIDESPLGIDACRLQKLHRLVALKRLGGSLPHSHQSEHQRQGQQHVEHRAHDIDEEVPELAAVRRCQAPQQRECHRDADGRRKEVLHRQTNRL